MGLSAWLAEKIYDFLNVAQAPRPVQCIFVLAGKPERKSFGIELWHSGYAPELILSVGRFEWRGFYQLGLADGGLKELVESTAPPKRHFFIRYSDQRAECVLVPKGRFGTLTEGEALVSSFPDEARGPFMLVSSALHLRRTALVFRRTFRGKEVDFLPVAVPEEMSSIKRIDLRQNAAARTEVFREFVKYLCYFALTTKTPRARRITKNPEL